MTESERMTAQAAQHLPVMIGDTVLDSEGMPHQVETASLIVRCIDGSERTAVLQKGVGDLWWVASGEGASAPETVRSLPRS